MAGEPTTPNIALTVPNTGDLVGTWGAVALNPDFVALDGMLGGVTTLSLGAAALTILTIPTAGTIAPTAGPNQSQNACINIIGIISGNQVIQLTMPGRYVFHNQMYNSPYTFYVQLTSIGNGRKVGLPPGKKTTVFHDGTNVDFVDQPDPGTAYDLHGGVLLGNVVLPAWMTACTVAPYLLKNGTIYTMSQYPALGNILGNTFGGDGVSTFAVPDEMARVRIPFDANSTGRMTSPISATVMGSTGGEQSHLLTVAELATHTHIVSDPTHSHADGFTFQAGVGAGGTSLQEQFAVGNANAPWSTSPSATNITNQNTGGNGAHNNVQPGIVSFLPLIKT
jgi:microcystin-dependent protein